MNIDRVGLVPFVALLASACGSGDGGSTLNHYGAEISDSVSAIETSLASHRDKVAVQTDLESVRAVEQHHMNEMGMHMGRMEDALNSMKACGSHMNLAGRSDAADQLHTAQGGMRGAMDDASLELSRHLKAMESASDLNTALEEETEHQSAMDDILGGMRMDDDDLGSAMQMMADDGMSMMCAMSSHMHR